MSSPIRRSLPLRGQADPEGPAAPKPFSREWLSLPPEARAVPARRRRIAVPSWLPSERALTMLLVALLVLTSTVIQTGLAPSVAGGAGSGNDDAPRVAGAGRLIDPTSTPTVVVPAVEPESTDEPTAAETGEPSPDDDADASDNTISLDGSGTGGQTEDADEPEATSTREAATETGTAAMEGAILPKNRILAYYGHPGNEQMGILGQFEMEELLAQLLDEAATYEAADPDRPVMPAFEVIASVAQSEPQADGSWLGHIDDETMMEYIEFTAEKGILLILDIQIGYTSVKEDMATVEKYLRYPHVHLAIDPEFALKEPDIPGQVIGGVDGKEITYAQNRLVEICAEEGIPPKVLIVHRFRHGMIRNDKRVKPVEGVQVVINMDGFGPPAVKIDSYRIFIGEKKPEYGGIKVFYDQDEPVMTAEEVLDLAPMPDYVQYH